MGNRPDDRIRERHYPGTLSRSERANGQVVSQEVSAGETCERR